jgi:hypothetical protein
MVLISSVSGGRGGQHPIISWVGKYGGENSVDCLDGWLRLYSGDGASTRTSAICATWSDCPDFSRCRDPKQPKLVVQIKLNTRLVMLRSELLAIELWDRDLLQHRLALCFRRSW